MTAAQRAIQRARVLLDAEIERRIERCCHAMADHGATTQELSDVIRSQWAAWIVMREEFLDRLRSKLPQVFPDGDDIDVVLTPSRTD